MLVDAIAGGVAGAGGQPESMAVECVRAGGIDVNFAAALRYPSGLLATVQSGFNAHQRVFSEIIGARGVLEIPDTFWSHAGEMTIVAGEERRAIAVPASESYQLEVEDFAGAILQRRAPQFSSSYTLRLQGGVQMVEDDTAFDNRVQAGRIDSLNRAELRGMNDYSALCSHRPARK